MALHQLSIPVGERSQAANLAKRLVGIEGPYPFHTTQHQQEFLHSRNVRLNLPGGTEYSIAFDSLGTIGRGNHFAEFLKIAEIRDQESATLLGLSSSHLLLLVHSGSRDVGQHVLENVTRQKEQSLTEGSTSMLRYLEEHNQALQWAKANQALIAKRVLDALGENIAAGSKELLDVWHNFVEKRTVSAGIWDGEGSKDVWMHRKGAASTFDGAVVIAGSRGARSYIVISR
jgi:release factor H-coupled RctB family protein